MITVDIYMKKTNIYLDTLRVPTGFVKELEKEYVVLMHNKIK